MSVKEVAVLHLLDTIKESQTRVIEWRQKLVTERTCTHSETNPHSWEHDGGYGKQTEMLGRRCRACCFIDYYLDGKWIAEV